MLWNRALGALTSGPSMEAQRQGELLSLPLYTIYTLYVTTLHYTKLYLLHYTKLIFTKLEYNTKFEGNIVAYCSLRCFVEENFAN